jgi:uncharacterized protein (TIGR02391 family)
MAIQTIPCFAAAQLESISKVLGDTSDGLTGADIGHFLTECRVPDVDPALTKWKRLYNALVHYQNDRQFGNHVVAFIHKAMNPARWVGERPRFDGLRSQLNVTLAFAGLTLGEDGKVTRTSSASTLAEAEQRADSLRSSLRARRVHDDVLLHCRAELLVENYFHAVLEATKSVASKLRKLSGLTGDGADLATKSLGIGSASQPLLAINSLSTDTEKGEQRGFMNLLVGLFGTFRNPTAHAEKISWPMGEQDALDILSLVSLVHRKLDCAKSIGAASQSQEREEGASKS